MNAARQRNLGKRGERGYALLVVVFLVTLLLISTMVVAPNIQTEGRREKEKEMIWRGKQYTRGVKLYYRKNGPLSHFSRRPHQTESRFPSLHAPGLQRSHEQGRWYLETYLCRGRWAVDWKSQTPPKSPASPSWRNWHPRKCFEWTGKSSTTRDACSTRLTSPAQRTRSAGTERNAACRIRLRHKSASNNWTRRERGSG